MGPSNATALIKIDDGEIARGQFDECRYSLNCCSRIERGTMIADGIVSRFNQRERVYLLWRSADWSIGKTNLSKSAGLNFVRYNVGSVTRANCTRAIRRTINVKESDGDSRERERCPCDLVAKTAKLRSVR